MAKKYDANSIEKLTFREGVRKRVGMYLGSPDMEGVYNGLFEIVSNSVDEAIVGYGKEIEITIDNNFIRVKDYGRGIPRGPKGNDPEILITLLTEGHSGAKFNNENYTKVRGLNGIGSGATNCSSDIFHVITKRDGYIWTLDFENGLPKTSTAIRGKPTKETGTEIYYHPSAEVFHAEPVKIDFNTVCERTKNISYLIPGLKFIVKNIQTKEKEIFLSKNGISDLIDDVVKNPLHKAKITGKTEDSNNSVEIAVQWSKTGNEKFYLFVNGAECPEGGTAITGIKSAITRVVNKEFKKSFSGDLARRGLTYVVSCSVTNAAFANQTKTKISNGELRGLADKAFIEGWKDFSLRYPNEVEKIKEFLTKEERADRAADKARQAIINSEKLVDKSKKEKSILAGKLVDCEEHGDDSILFCVEGKSAGGSIINARDSKNMAVLPLRGKIINALKSDVEDVLENGEVQDLITALGCGIMDKCNPKKLRYGKIGIFVDSDVDGYSIMCLLLTFFYKFMPQLIYEGKIYWIKSPLFAVIEKNGARHYAYDDDELNEILKKHKGDIKRAKGIGELSPEDIRNTVLDLEKSRITQLIVEDIQKANALFELLMGSDVEPRKDYIFEHLDFSEIYD